MRVLRVSGVGWQKRVQREKGKFGRSARAVVWCVAVVEMTMGERESRVRNKARWATLHAMLGT